jgi:imidazolonepropionase-like amidohydrolase
VILGVLLLVLTGLTPELAYADTVPDTEVIFKNVRIFNGFSDGLSGVSDVLVVNNKIEQISLTPIEPTKDENIQSTVIDGTGHVLIPGLIDNHVHIAMSGVSLEDLTLPDVPIEKIQKTADKEAKNMLLRGFTTVRDMSGPKYVFTLKKLIDKGDKTGPRIYPSGGMISQTSGHGDFRSLEDIPRRFGGELTRGEKEWANIIADGRDEVLTATRENLRLGATQIKLAAGGGVSSLYDPIDVVQYTPDELKAAVEAADDWGTYVAVHAYNSKSVKRAVEAGVKSIEHGHLIDEETMKLLADKGIWLSTQVFLLDSINPNLSEEQRAKKLLTVEGTDRIFQWAKKYNVNLAWGTDILFRPGKTDQQSLDIPKMKQWLSNFEILKLVTHDNAQLLKLSGPRNPYPGELGVIQPGAYADLVLLEGNPLDDISLLTKYETKFKVIMRDGKIYKNILN